MILTLEGLWKIFKIITLFNKYFIESNEGTVEHLVVLHDIPLAHKYVSKFLSNKSSPLNTFMTSTLLHKTDNIIYRTLHVCLHDHLTKLHFILISYS